MNITEITGTKRQSDEPTRLAAYCRVSSDSADQLHSFAAQIRYYSDYVKKHPEYRLVDPPTRWKPSTKKPPHGS